MRTSNVYPALTRLATATCIQEPSKGPSSTSFIALSHGFDTSRSDGLSKEVFFPCEYVTARATTCPNFQCLVYLCEASLSNCQPIMHSKHSYMHNHAFYVLIHPIILLYHTYMVHIQLSTVKFNTNCQTQFQFQFQLSISISIPTFKSCQMSMSMSMLISNVNVNVKCQCQCQC
jgi:hypothetical protein